MPEKKSLEYFDEILSYLEDRKSIEIRELSTYTGLDKEKAKEAVSILKKMGIIEEFPKTTSFGSKILNLNREIDE